MQPVKIIDPHLVSTFFDNYKRVYLYCTTELENRSNQVAECSLTIQVTTELEGNTCMVEHLQTEHVSIPAGSKLQHSFNEVGDRLIVSILLGGRLDCIMFYAMNVRRWKFKVCCVY